MKSRASQIGPSTPAALEQAAKAQILIVDDHPLARDGLAQLISRQPDLCCCSQCCSSATEVHAAVAKHSPDLVIMDLGPRIGDARELIKPLKSQHSNLRILVFSQHDGQFCIEEALRAGALGFVAKDQEAGEVLKAIRVVLAGEISVTLGIAALLLKKFIRTGGEPGEGIAMQLTNRELHIFQLMGVGWSTREIAAFLNRSIKTIESHRENIKRKLQLEGAAQLIGCAIQCARKRIALPVPAEIPMYHLNTGDTVYVP